MKKIDIFKKVYCDNTLFGCRVSKRELKEKFNDQTFVDDTIEKFFDADSLINFIKENNSQVVVYENSQTRFVYDEEIEKLVNDCFNEHGDGNLLIEFG